ncbi:MAG: response regulator, partial [Clostridiales bacterium]|nr:response regulator [Clostridiales bacterium]
MYRLLLLDDEEFVLKGIQRVYDLPSYGFEVVGAFSNPLKALEQLEELKPDLVITDVKMPAMDGLEFADEAKKRNPGVEVVILSGYDDFSYAQAAVRLGVSDYLLKPIKKDDFIAMLRHMYSRIEEKQSREKSYQVLQKLLKDNWVELKNRYYLELTESDDRDEELYG